MFEEGSLLLFHPFLFKNGAQPKDKFLLVLCKDNDEMLLVALPTSKDHVPSDMEVKHGCYDHPDRFLNIFVFMAGERIAVRSDGSSFSFSKPTFIYGANLDSYRSTAFEQQEQAGQTVIQKIGTINQAVFAELKECLSNSKMVKNKYRKMLRC